MSVRLLPVLILAVLLGGCLAERQKKMGYQTRNDVFASTARLDTSADPLAQGRQHFRNEDYGLAEVYFRKAIERNPNNTDAWIGLAASYDRLRRFDLAERAYGVIVKKVGYTVTVHNNLGYHHYLRGNLAEAEKHFRAAETMDPDNPLVQDNLKLLTES